MSPPPLDVVIPLWTDSGDHLSDAIDSLRPYMRPIIVVNGENADEVANSLHDLGLLTPVPLAAPTVVSLGTGEGCYLCRARNLGVELATTEYVGFLDADDLYLEGIDEVYVNAAEWGPGAWGDQIVATADGTFEHHRDQSGNPWHVLPHIDTVIVRRTQVPKFDVWAEHQQEYRGLSYERQWWGKMQQLIHVPVHAALHRMSWSKRQASLRFREAGGWIGEGERPGG